MSHLIDVDKLIKRVAKHLELTETQVATELSLPEQIKLLCDELDHAKSGKPDWMRRDG